jgi:hypothetical protein
MKTFGDLQWSQCSTVRGKKLMIGGFRGELLSIDIQWLDSNLMK